MELKRQLFRQNLLRSKAFTQITLDDDCIVKDNKPDLLNIIHTRGSVIFDGCQGEQPDGVGYRTVAFCRVIPQ